MKILFLSPHKHLIPFIETLGDEVVQTIEPLTDELIKDVDWIISYGYKHILKKPILELFKGRAINLHISYLPWNRGADPNLWSFLEATPKGVTIHFIDEGIDTGDIIAQRYIKYEYHTDTLRTFYIKLSECIEDMFQKVWPYIREGKARSYKQGTYHEIADKEKYSDLLTNGWDTPIKHIIAKGVK